LKRDSSVLRGACGLHKWHFLRHRDEGEQMKQETSMPPLNILRSQCAARLLHRAISKATDVASANGLALRAIMWSTMPEAAARTRTKISPGAVLGTTSTRVRQRAYLAEPQRPHSPPPARSPRRVLYFRVGGYFPFRSGSLLRSLMALPASAIAFRIPVTVSSKYAGPASTFQSSRVNSLLKPSFWSRFSVS